MPDVVRYGIVCLVVLVTNFQEGVTGFGCTALALPFVVMLLGLDVAKPVLVLLAYILNMSNTIISRRKIMWTEYARILILTGIAMPAGMWLSDVLPERELKLILAVFMLGIGIHGFATLSRKAAFFEVTGRVRLFMSGFLPLGGIIHGAFGSGGPLLIVYATKVLRNKSVFRGTLSLVWLTLNTILIGTWAAKSYFNPHIFRVAALCLPFTITGLILGNYAHNRIDDFTFRRMVYIVLGLAGAALLWSVLSK